MEPPAYLIHTLSQHLDSHHDSYGKAFDELLAFSRKPGETPLTTLSRYMRMRQSPVMKDCLENYLYMQSSTSIEAQLYRQMVLLFRVLEVRAPQAAQYTTFLQGNKPRSEDEFQAMLAVVAEDLRTHDRTQAPTGCTLGA